MRNLKKFLALVLAMMMTLSLMVSVNAASDFKDAEDINEKFSEAVQVLEGIGVFKGYTDGSFKPTDKITRAEVAAIVYRLATGDAKENQAHLYVDGAAKFSDVEATDWFAGVVGFCTNSELVSGYGDGRFGPNDDVTGVQALTMILRAVGYGKGGEFQGWGWETNVYSRARSEGLLNNVDKTNYASKLSVPATRELVAELLFQAAQIPTVTWTQALGYNKGDTLLGLTGEQNPSLGKKFYGLSSLTGIIVGNQATGEKETKLGVMVDDERYAVGVSYIYETDDSTVMTAGNTANATLSFGTETGLDKFGHKVRIWYNFRSNDATDALTVGDTTTISLPDHYSEVYTVVDQSTKSAVVYADDADLTTSTAALNKAAKAAGFSVASTGAYVSDNFSQIDGTKVTTDVTDDKGTSGAFLLVSNSGTTLDLIVPLEVSVDSIDAVNNYSKPKTVTHDTDSTEIARSAPSAKDKSLLVYGEEAIAVGQLVVLNKIYGTGSEGITTPGTQYFYGIDALTEEKEATITGISSNGTVTLKGGETIKRSPLWNVTGGGTGVDDLTIGNTVTFILDVNGAYVDCYVGGATTLAGAYGYWTQEGIDGFKYYLQGVTNKGEIVTREVTKDSYNSVIAVATDNVEIRHMTSGSTAGTDTSVHIAGIGSAAAGKMNGYLEYTINGANVVSATTAWSKKIDMDNKQSWTAKTDKVTGTANYFDKNTQFHVVSGWGSTLKVDHYTGLTDLLQGAASIEVAGWYFTGPDDTEHVGSQNNLVKHVVIVSAARIQPNSFLYSEKAITGATAGIATVDGKAHQLMLRVAGEKDETGILVFDKTASTAEDTTANTFYRYTVTAEGYYDITADAMDGSEYGYKADNALTNAGTAFGDIKEGTTSKVLHAADAKVIDLTDHGIDSYAALRRAVEENSGIKVDVLLTSAGGDTASVIYVHTFA